MLKSLILEYADKFPYDTVRDPIRELGLRSISLDQVEADLDWLECLIENCRSSTCISAAINLTEVDLFLKSRS